jgi:hypothetical protein
MPKKSLHKLDSNFNRKRKLGVKFTSRKKDEVKLSLPKQDGVKFMILSSNSSMFQNIKSEQWWDNNEIGRQDECHTIYTIFSSVLQLLSCVELHYRYKCYMGSTTFKEKGKKEISQNLYSTILCRIANSI